LILSAQFGLSIQSRRYSSRYQPAPSIPSVQSRPCLLQSPQDL
jgi:hypothetical protein